MCIGFEGLYGMTKWSTVSCHHRGGDLHVYIDDIIKEDKLGLGFICVQAKRWQNQVGVGTVREFAGSFLNVCLR